MTDQPNLASLVLTLNDDVETLQRQLAQAEAELRQARADLLRAELLLTDLCDGALEQSQSHADVLAKIETYYGAVFDNLPPLLPAECERVKRIAAALLARIREG